MPRSPSLGLTAMTLKTFGMMMMKRMQKRWGSQLHIFTHHSLIIVLNGRSTVAAVASEHVLEVDEVLLEVLLLISRDIHGLLASGRAEVPDQQSLVTSGRHHCIESCHSVGLTLES